MLKKTSRCKHQNGLATFNNDIFMLKFDNESIASSGFLRPLYSLFDTDYFCTNRLTSHCYNVANQWLSVVCLLKNVEVRVARGDNTTTGPVGFSVTVTTTVNGTTYPSETSNINLVAYQAALISGSSTPIDFSAPGIYNIQCVISYGGTITANDTITTSVISSVTGTLSPDDTVCEGGNGQIALSGNSGEIVQWEESIDGGSNWSILGNTSNTLNFSNLAQTTLSSSLPREFDTLIQAGGDVLGFEAGQQSGWAVTLNNSGTRLAVGEFETNAGEGSVRVFDYNGATWAQVGDTLRGSQ